MKHLWSIFPIAIALSVKAQTNLSGPGTGAEAAPAVAVPPAAISTNVPASTNVIAPGRPKTEIFSESGHFDLKDRVMVYIGNVRVLDPQMKLTCDIMTVSIPESGRSESGRPDKIVAEQNVVIDATDNEGKPVHATGDKAVYTYRVVNTTNTYRVANSTNTYRVVNSITNETVVLTGNPRVQRKDDWMTGDEITWDRANNSFGATHPHMVLQAETKEHTNTPASPPKARN